MKKLILLSHFNLPTILLAVLLAPVFPAQSKNYDDIGSVQSPDAAKWGGLRWSASERKLFQGRPQMANDSDTNDFVIVAYDRYVSDYDLKGNAPRWVAYVTDRASAKVMEQNTRKGAEFARPGFFTDGVIADACARINVQPTVDDDYSDCVPEGLSAADQIPTNITATKASHYAAFIERGHLAPNATLKAWGTTTQGKNAQYESFSLANVVPEMSEHNAPTWSALEGQCLVWAKELGKVCIIAGPIYNDPAHPRHIHERRTGQQVDIPFADSLFCVVIGKRDGKTSAIGFIMPESTAKYSFKTNAVPIDKIEQATGINFMPQLGEPNPLETNVDTNWLNN